MRFFFILGFVALTSVGGYLYGKEVLRLPSHGLSAALRSMLECVWFGLVFFTLNLLVGFMGILASRVAVGSFISLYEVSDITLLIFSLLQGIMFQLWRRETARLGR